MFWWAVLESFLSTPFRDPARGLDRIRPSRRLGWFNVSELQAM